MIVKSSAGASILVMGKLRRIHLALVTLVQEGEEERWYEGQRRRENTPGYHPLLTLGQVKYVRIL